MQKVIRINDIQNYFEYIDQSVIDYIGCGQTETFESFEAYSLIAFDWYDLKNQMEDPSQILVYFDKDDLFYICENERSYSVASELFVEAETNEQAMYYFFQKLFSGSVKYLEDIENRVSDLDDKVTDGIIKDMREKILDVRREILLAKRYYDQMEFLLEEICDNDNDLISENYLKYFEILRNRSSHFVSQAMYLREYITQVRESYQSEIGIEQNNLMRVFTLVTSIFLPLSLIAGWYGMNVKMPEFSWEYGYAFVIGLCLFVTLVWFIFFKCKNWYK